MKRILIHIVLLLACLAGTVGCAPEGYKFLEAIQRGEVEAVRSMLDKGVPANEVPEGADFFPLEVAAGNNRPVIAQMLIGYGAHPDSARSDVSPLWLALNVSAQSVAVVLIEAGATVEGAPQNGMTTLMHAATFGLDSVVPALIARGVELNPVEPKLRPLGEAVAALQYNTTEQLLEAGGDPNLLNLIQEPPIFSAFQLDSLEIARLLLDHGANINQGDANGWTLAFQKDFMGKEQLEQAIEWGLDLEIKDKWNDTPLHNAVLNGWTDYAEILLDLGANPNARNVKGLTPARAAEISGKPELVRLITERGGKLK